MNMNVGSAGALPPFRPAAPSIGPFGVYYGWYNVALCLVCIMFTVGSTNYSFGLFIKPAAAELGISRANTNLGLILFHVGSAVIAPVIGNLLDRLPIKLVMRVSAALFTTGMVGVGLSDSPLLIALFIVIPLAWGTVGGSSMFGIVLNSRWFTDRRGRALALVALGTSFGGMFVFPIIAALMSFLGWRGALIATGFGVGAVLIIASFFVRSRPDPETNAQLEERAPVKTGKPLSNKEILLTRDFWFIAIPVAMLLSIDGALLATITPYLLDRGFSITATASIMSATTASAIAGKLLIAVIADRTDLRLLLALTAMFGVILCGTLLTDPSYGVVLVVSLLTGLAIGGAYPLKAAITAQRFGSASVGRAMGMMLPMMSVAAMGCLYFVGAVYDRTGSYHYAFMVFGLGVLAATAFMPFISKGGRHVDVEKVQGMAMEAAPAAE